MNINSTEWMVATMARRAKSEAPAVALANAYTDVTGESYEEYKQLCRMRIQVAGEIAYRKHCERAAAQRAAA